MLQKRLITPWSTSFIPATVSWASARVCDGGADGWDPISHRFGSGHGKQRRRPNGAGAGEAVAVAVPRSLCDDGL